ncbi:MAG: hypothetical protein IH892_00145 [Planctomycetes bacterium]|nr:hypothetical protein [Planctomycetota bacterium]
MIEFTVLMIERDTFFVSPILVERVVALDGVHVTRMGFKLEGASLVIDLGDGPLHVRHGTVIDPQVTEQDIAGPIDNQGTIGWMDDQHGVSSVNRDMRCSYNIRRPLASPCGAT